MRILILGYSQSGKTTAGDLLATNGISVSTSDVLIKRLAERDHLKVKTILDDKQHYRDALWALGRELQKDDPSTIIREALVNAAMDGMPKPWKKSIIADRLNGDDIIAVTGMRNVDELSVCRNHGLFDVVIWIKNFNAKPNSTDHLGPSHADEIVINNGTKAELRQSLLCSIRHYKGSSCDVEWVCSGLEVFDR